MRHLNQLLVLVLWTAVLGGAGRARADEGADAFKTCGNCHNADNHPLDSIRMTREKWKEALERMEGLGADIPSGKTRSALLDYLEKTHGPAGEGASGKK
jgi:hypothetical protein